MKLSGRETVLLIATFFAILFGGTLMLARPAMDKLEVLLEEQEQIVWQIKKSKDLVARKEGLETKLSELSKMLAPAPVDNMGVHWQQILEKIAKKNSVKIITSKAGLEKKQGEVYELPIECREWEGDLGGIVHFLFDLQLEGAMLDVRRLMVKPKADMVLRGSFVLYCAYTRPDKAGGEGAVKEKSE